MVNGISSDASSLQILRATQAFKRAIQSSPGLNNALDENIVKNTEENTSFEPDYKLKKLENSITKNQSEYTAEIKQIASKYGKTDLNDDEINYAMRYGRSILVDQTG